MAKPSQANLCHDEYTPINLTSTSSRLDTILHKYNSLKLLTILTGEYIVVSPISQIRKLRPRTVKLFA